MALRGPIPRVFTLSVRTLKERGGPVHDSVKDPDRLELDPDWRHLLILVHGFNNPESEAEEKYERYIDMLRPLLERSRVAPDAVAKFHWPGNEAVVGKWELLDVAGYPIDVQRARESVGPFVAFLGRVVRDGPPTRMISIVGHSLGCRLIAETMLHLHLANPPRPPLGVVTLMAAAVPVDLARPGALLETAPTAAAKMLSAHSRRDWVLLVAFPSGQQLAALKGIEAAAYKEAVGRNGNPLGYGESVPREKNGHSDYWTDEYAAASMLVTMDATLRSLPPEAVIAPNDLPSAGEIQARRLGSRRLPT